jgi:hypothetical protein
MSDTSQTVTIAQPDSDPVEVIATVVTVEHRQEPEVFGGVRQGLYAQLDITQRRGEPPATYFLSRLVDETHWIIDAQFTANGFPVHSNGLGARYLRVRAIAPELAALLDAEARARRLVKAISPDTPLKLDALNDAETRPADTTEPASESADVGRR